MRQTAQTMRRLLAAFPESADDWQRYQYSDSYEPGEPYNDVSWMAHRLVGSMKASKTAGFDTFFLTIEGMLESASSEVRELMTAGFLEDLQNSSLNSSIPLEAWEPWLGPSARDAWRAVAGLWSGDLPADEFNRHVRGAVSQP